MSETDIIERSVEQLAIFTFLHDQNEWGRRGEVQEDGKVKFQPWEEAGLLAQTQYRDDAATVVGVMLRLGWEPPKESK
jgi:hypothetical protein